MIKGKPGEPGKPGKDLRVGKSITITLSLTDSTFYKYFKTFFCILFSK